MKTALSIAGSDPSGGAGIQADLKTMTLNGVYAMCAITALTAQNTLGVTDIVEVSPSFLGAQLDAVFQDIPPDGVKTGMVASVELIRVIGEKLRQYRAVNLVVDPVMVSTSGSRLLRPEAADALEEELFPLATVVTPNIPEAQVLAGMEIHTPRDMETAARIIGERHGCGVLCKGGHSVSDANDYLYCQGRGEWFAGERVENPNTHGTGCTLSSAIAANLAKGQDLVSAVAHAKEYLTGALSAMLNLGHGSGPLDHGYILKQQRGI